MAVRPRRLLHDVVTLTLMLGVLTLLSMAAAAGPIYAEAVSDAAVRQTLDSVPAGTPAKTAAVVRLNGGIDPEGAEWTALLRSLEELPGVGPARVSTRGEQQRVAIARAAALSPAVIVLDEPTSHQDEAHADLVAHQLFELARAGSAVLVATHDPRLVSEADQVVHLHAGRHHRGSPLLPH